VAELLRPARGGFLRPFGCGWFIREFLLGHGPNGSPRIDPEVGAPQADIFYHYKTALIKATAVDKATRREEKQARRERRTISPEEIDRLADRYLVFTSQTFKGWVGWSLPVKKMHQPFKTTTHQGNLAGISASLMLAKQHLRQLGQILTLPSTAGARGEAGNLGSLNPFSIPLFLFQNPQIKISRKYRFILLMHNRSFCWMI